MSKSLRSIKSPSEKAKTIRRRIAEQKDGLGYISACMALYGFYVKPKRKGVA